MRISVLCALTLLACISVNQAAVRVVEWPPKSGGRNIQDNNGKTFPKALADPLRWVSAKDSQRYFENTDGMNWVEMQVGKNPNMFTEVSRVGSDKSLVVVLKRSDKLYVKLSEGMAWWSWNMGFPEKYQIGEGSWKKVDSTRNAVDVVGPYKIISRGEPVTVGEDCEEEQDKVGPYTIISRGEPVKDKVGPYTIISRGEPVQDKVGPYTIISRGEPIQYKIGPYTIISRGEPVQDKVGPYTIISRGEPVQDKVGPYTIISRGEPIQYKVGPYTIISRGEPVTVSDEGDSNTRELVQPIKWQNANQEDHYFEKIDDFRWGEYSNGQKVFNFIQVKVLAGSPNDPENFEVLLRKQDSSFVRLTNQQAWWGAKKDDISVNFANGFWLTTDSSRNSQQRNLLQELGSKEGDCMSPSIDDNNRMW